MFARSFTWALSFSTAPLSTPKIEPKPLPHRLEALPGPKKPRRGWLIAIGVIAAVGIGVWMAQKRLSPPPVARLVRTSEVQRGTFEKNLRIAGTVAARRFAAIVAPRLTGPESGGPLTLMKLAGPGSIVKAGSVVAVFEQRESRDHVDDVRSRVAQKASDVDKRRAEIMIAEETVRQKMRTAKGEYEKAKQDVRTVEVRSEIEAAILKLAVKQTEAEWKQLEQELALQEKADKAELAGLDLEVQTERNHLDRHVRDLDHMTMKTPVPGLVVMESTFRGGTFDQVQAGDQVYPGTFFMQVVDVSRMVVNGSANQADIQGIHLGQKAQVRLDAYPDTVFPGEVTSIGALASAGGSGNRRFGRGAREDWVRGVEVQIEIQAEDQRIIPDLSVSADITLAERPDQLIIPREAVKVREDGSGIVQVREGQGFRPREVELGEMNATHAIVLAGLSENEVVAVEDPTGS